MKKDNPGIYIPPPLIYMAFFFFSFFLQKLWPFGRPWPDTDWVLAIGLLFIGIGTLLIYPAIKRFIDSKNTLITVRPANSLQTTGIYALTRNPMYMGLLFLYCGIAFFEGNYWTFILVPLLILVIQLYLIKKEEEYLQRTFGEEYKIYRKRVRTWI